MALWEHREWTQEYPFNVPEFTLVQKVTINTVQSDMYSTIIKKLDILGPAWAYSIWTVNHWQSESHSLQTQSGTGFYDPCKTGKWLLTRIFKKNKSFHNLQLQKQTWEAEGNAALSIYHLVTLRNWDLKYLSIYKDYILRDVDLFVCVSLIRENSSLLIQASIHALKIVNWLMCNIDCYKL